MNPQHQQAQHQTKPGEWSYGLCDCCTSRGCGDVCFFMCCPMCYKCRYAETMVKMDQSKSCFWEFLRSTYFAFCCRPCQRTEVREHYGIEGDSCNDCMTSLCCIMCADMQEMAEIDLQVSKSYQQPQGQTVIYVQPNQPQYYAQPQPQQQYYPQQHPQV